MATRARHSQLLRATALQACANIRKWEALVPSPDVFSRHGLSRYYRRVSLRFRRLFYRLQLYKFTRESSASSLQTFFVRIERKVALTSPVWRQLCIQQCVQQIPCDGKGFVLRQRQNNISHRRRLARPTSDETLLSRYKSEGWVINQSLTLTRWAFLFLVSSIGNFTTFFFFGKI